MTYYVLLAILIGLLVGCDTPKLPPGADDAWRLVWADDSSQGVRCYHWQFDGAESISCVPWLGTR